MCLEREQNRMQEKESLNKTKKKSKDGKQKGTEKKFIKRIVC